jgi:hypothetical protein
MLEDRLKVKATNPKIVAIQNRKWLALYNHYFLADISTYKQAYEQISLKHPFEKILIVTASKVVAEIFA